MKALDLLRNNWITKNHAEKKKLEASSKEIPVNTMTDSKQQKHFH